MSGVVLRCPNCGTTRAQPGECEVCHAEQVAYFCSNHSPGFWLDGPACSRCGARFGEAPPPPPPPEREREPTRPPQARSPRRDAGRGPLGDHAWGHPRGPAEPEPEPEIDPRAAAWRDMLRGIARARAADAGRRAETRTTVASGLGGCLLRLIMMLVFLVMAVFGGLLLFTGSMFRIF